MTHTTDPVHHCGEPCLITDGGTFWHILPARAMRGVLSSYVYASGLLPGVAALRRERERVSNTSWEAMPSARTRQSQKACP